MEVRKELGFANTSTGVQSWYLICKSSKIKKGKKRIEHFFGKDLVIFRGEDNKLRAIDSHCPHMGAMLNTGKVIDNCIRCPFHHWHFNGDGRCVSIPYKDDIPAKAKVAAFPIEEKHGCVWVFNGPKKLFDVPQFGNSEDYFPLKLGTQYNNAHPHIMMGNSLDIPHWECVHGIKITYIEEIQKKSKHQIEYKMEGELIENVETFIQKFLKVLKLSKFKWKFTVWGGNVACIKLMSPIEYNFIISFSPTTKGGNKIQTIALLKKPNLLMRFTGLHYLIGIIKAIIVTLIFCDDIKVMKTIKFKTGFTKEDKLMARFIRYVNRLETN